jgi:hypothetical protein
MLDQALLVNEYASRNSLNTVTGADNACFVNEYVVCGSLVCEEIGDLVGVFADGNKKYFQFIIKDLGQTVQDWQSGIAVRT